MKNYYRSLLLPVSLVLVTSACSESSSSSSTLTGQLMFSGLNGLSYKTATQEGVLDEAGTYKYLAGETISFSLGNLPLVEDVPAREFLSFLEFGIDERVELDDGTVEEGFSTHAQAEVNVSKQGYTNNLSRFIYMMGDIVKSNSAGNDPIFITDWTIEQLNAYLLTDAPPVDFNVSIDEFEAEGSPFNLMLENICFFPEDFIECEEPPTQAEIDEAESRFDENGDERTDLDPDKLYKEDLEIKKKIIASGVRTASRKSDAQTATALQNDANDIHSVLSADIYFNEYSANIKEGDFTPRTVEIRSERSPFALIDMEVVSLNENIAIVDSFDVENKTFTFTSIGKLGEETTLIVNLKQVDDYRWYRKTFRVLVE